MMETEEQTNNSRPWLFQPGKSGNPGGRPKGSKSLKTYAQEMLRDMTDDEKFEFLKGLDKKVIWEMAESKPKQDNDFTSGGKPIQVVVPPQLVEAFEINATHEETSGSDTE